MREDTPGAGLLVVAGEPSGDRAAARVVRELAPLLAVPPFGIGGAALAEAGLELLADADDLAAIGPVDALRRARFWVAAWCAVREAVPRRRPRAALLVDAPDFNLPLAGILRRQGIPVIQYVGPQVWAWRPGRLGLLRRRVEMVALVLPFEEDIYRRAGVPAVFVGHPLLDEPPPGPREETRQRLGIGRGRPAVALLPGSRAGEVSRHSPAMLDAAGRLRRRGIVTVFAPRREADEEGFIDRASGFGCMVPPAGLGIRDILAGADAALIASGTATLEAALSGTPLAALYRLAPPSALAAGFLLRAPYVSLPNWVAGRAVVPELLQGRVTGRRLAAAALELLDPAVADRQRHELRRVRELLGAPGASRRVARMVAGYLA